MGVSITNIESFDQTFSKVCGFQRRSLGRSRRSEIPFPPLFFLLAFSFVPVVSKEKAENDLDDRYRCRRENALAFTFPETGEGGSPIVFKARRMRLTHYEDGLLCGERFCINLIRHCGDTFPGLGEGKG